MSLNEWFVMLGIESWKPVLTALVLPPVPGLVLVLAGWRVSTRRRGLGLALLLLGVVSLWAGTTNLVGQTLMRTLLAPPPALAQADVDALARGAARAPRTAIVVLGGGRELYAPEYGMSSLSPFTLERLRYGLWLARQTGLPLAFSGGVGHGAPPGPSEAEIARRIAEREFGRRIDWIEPDSRDTQENAQRTVPLLAAQRIERIVLVTHGFHMPRARAAFERAAARGGRSMEIVAAPIGMSVFEAPVDIDLLPSSQGFGLTRLALREWLGRLAGA